MSFSRNLWSTESRYGWFKYSSKKRAAGKCNFNLFFFSYCSQCRRSLKNDSLSNELKLTEYVTVMLEFEFSCFQLIYILLIRSRILYEVIKCILLVSALNPIGLWKPLKNILMERSDVQTIKLTLFLKLQFYRYL